MSLYFSPSLYFSFSYSGKRTRSRCRILTTQKHHKYTETTDRHCQNGGLNGGVFGRGGI